MQSNETTASPAVQTAAATPSPAPTQSARADTFAYDSSLPFNAKEVSVKETETGVKVHEVKYDTHDKSINKIWNVTCYVVEPKGNGPFPFVLYLHWLGNKKANKKEFLDEATAMAEKGVGGLLLDGFFPWKGLPAGNTEKDKSLIIYQVIELRRALDYIASLPYADTKRIAYVGHDYGAMFGAMLSGVDRRVRSYVLVTGMGNFSHWFLEYWIHLDENGKQNYTAAISPLDPVNFVKDAAPAALFFQFANKDEYIPKATADEFYAAASEPKEVKFYDSDHYMDNENARTDRDNWLLEKLK